MSQSVKREMTKKAVSSSSWCPRHARRGCFPGCLRLWRRKSAPLLLLFGPRTHNKTRRLHFPPPLDALNSREGEQRCVSAAQSPSRALPPMDSCPDQSQLAWVERLPAESQSGRGAGGGTRGGPLMGLISLSFLTQELVFVFLICSDYKMYFYLKYTSVYIAVSFSRINPSRNMFLLHVFMKDCNSED